jgi:hypothetical protein
VTTAGNKRQPTARGAATTSLTRMDRTVRARQPAAPQRGVRRRHVAENVDRWECGVTDCMQSRTRGCNCSVIAGANFKQAILSSLVRDKVRPVAVQNTDRAKRVGARGEVGMVVLNPLARPRFLYRVRPLDYIGGPPGIPTRGIEPRIRRCRARIVFAVRGLPDVRLAV